MANFCGTCGASTGGSKFCPKCGSLQTNGPRATYAPAVRPPAKSGFPALKSVFIILAVMILLGIAGVLGALYWAKGRVEELAHSSSATSLREAVSSATSAQPTRPGCQLLSKEKASEILDVTVVRAEGNDAGDMKEFCNYWSNETAAGEDSKKTSDENPPSASKDGPATLKDLQDLAKNISASADSHTPQLGIQVFRGTAKVALLSLKTANLVTGQRQGKIAGPWDEAYFGPFDAVLFVRKGDNGLMLDLHHVPEPREKALALAKTLAPGI